MVLQFRFIAAAVFAAGAAWAPAHAASPDIAATAVGKQQIEKSSPALLAQAMTEKEAFEAAKSIDTVGGWQAFLKHYQTGFRSDLARAYLDKLQGGATNNNANNGSSNTNTASSSQPVRIETIDARRLNVGKWPERVTFDGRYLWVSESGIRRISRVDPSSGRVRRYKVGRLPVDIVALPNGDVVTLAQTDNKIWRVREGRSKAKKFASTLNCPESMVHGGGRIWIMSKPSCYGDGATRLQYIKDGSSRVRELRVNLKAGATEIAAGQGQVYVAHLDAPTRVSTVSIVDPDQNDKYTFRINDTLLSQIAASDTGVFAAGLQGVFGAGRDRGVVLRVSDPVVDRVDTGMGWIMALAATSTHVVAIGENGTIWVMSAPDLTVIRKLRIAGHDLKPRDVLIEGDTLYITSFDSASSDNGDYAIIVVDDWM